MGKSLLQSNTLRRRNDYLMWYQLIRELDARDLKWAGISHFGGYHRLHRKALTNSKFKSVLAQYKFYRTCGFNVLISCYFMFWYAVRAVGKR